MDDQDLVLDSPNYMPNLQSMIVSQGVTMRNGFVATPVCCPSRVELITGRYYHNIGAPNGECMHIDATSNVLSNHSLFSIMNKHGYKTGVFGKLTNFDPKYFCKFDEKRNGNITNITDIAGMSRVYSMCNQSDYYTTKYFDKHENNTYRYTNLSYDDPGTYQTSQIGNESIKWIEEKLENKEKFIAYVGSHGPHEPFVVPAWFANTLSKDVIAPRTENFNVNVSNTLPYIVNNPMLDNKTISFIDQIYRDRIESTLQVDVIINDLMNLLDKYNEIDNTYIIYLSDHGFHLGQWRVPCAKTLIYETDIRIPFYIRGPNITYNSTNDIIVGNVDIMPLILDIINVDNNDKNIMKTDGKSFKSQILNNTEEGGNYNNKSGGSLIGGVAGDINIMGKDKNNSRQSTDWRSEFLVEYIIGGGDSKLYGDSYFNTCRTWFESDNDFHGVLIRPDAKSSDELSIIYGRNYDIAFSNTYRMLRIINETHDWTYAEYVNYSFTSHDFENPLFYALYDIKKDKYQINNVYSQLDNATKSQLHQMLLKYGSCESSNCP